MRGALVVQKIGIFLAAVGLLIVAASLATAEIGPCLPDKEGVLVCGEGIGAALVVEGTISPSKRLAFAWRSPSGRPTEERDLDALEILLIRFSDGAVLWKAHGEYWKVGDSAANHVDESAAWSPDSRFVVETTNFKWETGHLRLFTIGADNNVGVLDLKAIIEPAVRKHLRQHVKNPRAYVFYVSDYDPPVTIDDRGLVKAQILMQIPKEDPDVMFDVALQVSQNSGSLSTQGISIRRSRKRP
jgi:hypothetical protein